MSDTTTQRIVLVTGGVRGIGRAIADGFVAAGDDVLVTSRSPDVEARARGMGARGAQVDLESVESIAALRDVLGPVHVVVNNAGGFAGTPPPVGSLTGVAEHWRRTFAVNVVGAALVVAALEDRIAAGGTVVNLGSIGAEYAGNPYSAAKAALQAWSAGLAQRLGPRDITVNSVAPGFVEGTDLFGGPLSAARRDALVARGRRSRRAPAGRGGPRAVPGLPRRPARHGADAARERRGAPHAVRSPRRAAAPSRRRASLRTAGGPRCSRTAPGSRRCRPRRC